MRLKRKYHNYADAYYWRAWNHYQRKDLVAARADVDQSRVLDLTISGRTSYLNTANCYAMAGEIEKAREWLAKVPADSIHALTAAQLRKLIGGGVSSDKM